MKKLIIAIVLFLLPVTSSMAAFYDDQELRSDIASDIGSGILLMSFASSFYFGEEYGYTGPNKSDDTFHYNMLIGSTVSAGVASHIISSSSSDKKDDKRASLILFIDNNMDNLARDMSRGEGEVLSTLTILWGMSEEGETIFNDLVQENLEDVFISENITSKELLTNLNTLVLNNRNLAKYSIV